MLLTWFKGSIHIYLINAIQWGTFDVHSHDCLEGDPCHTYVQCIAKTSSIEYIHMYAGTSSFLRDYRSWHTCTPPEAILPLSIIVANSCTCASYALCDVVPFCLKTSWSDLCLLNVIEYSSCPCRSKHSTGNWYRFGNMRPCCWRVSFMDVQAFSILCIVITDLASSYYSRQISHDVAVWSTAAQVT
jgi:hypothetical protein